MSLYLSPELKKDKGSPDLKKYKPSMDASNDNYSSVEFISNVPEIVDQIESINEETRSRNTTRLIKKHYPQMEKNTDIFWSGLLSVSALLQTI